MKEDKRTKKATEPNRKAEEADAESRRRRQKWYADLQASYDRRLGVPLGVAKHQEKLIRDARTYATSYLLEAHSPVDQLRVTRLALRDLGITPNTEKFPLSFEALHAAIWTEGYPSLEELANEAGEDESADTQTRPMLNGREGDEMNPAKLSGKPQKRGSKTDLEQRLAAAMEVFERQPGYEKAQVWLSKRMEKVCKAAGPESALPIGSPARAELVLELFAVRAKAYLRLISNIEAQNAFLVMLEYFEILAWEDFVGGYPTSVREGAPSIDQQIGARKRYWIRKGYERLDAHATKRGAAGMRQQDPESAVDPGASAGKPEFHAGHWGEVEISFFNEFSVQITAGKTKANREYGTLGMAYKRSDKPTSAWQTLHDLARTNPPGTIARPTGKAKKWSTQEKRMQELRTWFRDRFGLSDDPLPFVKGIGYRAKFKISLAPSYQR